MNDKNVLNVLSVYSNDVTDWVIAYSREDAVKVWEQTAGESYNIEDCGEFVKEEDNKNITFFDEDSNTTIPVNATRVSDRMFRATCREWADTLGRSFFCSTEC